MSRPLFSIRKAETRDAPAIFAVHKASVHELCAKSYSPEHMASWFEDRSPEIYSPALAAERIWVAEYGGSIVGFVGAQPGEVTLLFVSPRATGQGVGSRLFEHGLTVAEGATSEPVMVVATKNSESFYAAHGFVAVEEQWFERGAMALRYPVVKMLRQGRTHSLPHSADA
jgi:predicted N-acetyltransferase YhbS